MLSQLDDEQLTQEESNSYLESIYSLLKRYLGWFFDGLEHLTSLLSSAYKYFTGYDFTTGKPAGETERTLYKDLSNLINAIPEKLKAAIFGEEETPEISEEAQKYGIVGRGMVNEYGAAEVAYGEIPDTDKSPEAARARKLAGKNRLVGKEWVDFQKEHPELVDVFNTGTLLIREIDFEKYGMPKGLMKGVPAAPKEKEKEPGEEEPGIWDKLSDKASEYYGDLKESASGLGEEAAKGFGEAKDWVVNSEVGKKIDEGIDYIGKKGEEFTNWAADTTVGKKFGEKAEQVGGIIESGKNVLGFAEGGEIQSGGKAVVHSEEEIIPAAQAKSGPGAISVAIDSLRYHEKTASSSLESSLVSPNITINITNNNPVVDSLGRIDKLSQQLRFDIDRQVRDVMQRQLRFYTR